MFQQSLKAVIACETGPRQPKLGDNPCANSLRKIPKLSIQWTFTACEILLYTKSIPFF